MVEREKLSVRIAVVLEENQKLTAARPNGTRANTATVASRVATIAMGGEK